ncbi:MAG: ABC transporter permease [Actinomycetia bacterium]|nr:ABC transporter permease [Actinomycetes bacterium]
MNTATTHQPQVGTSLPAPRPVPLTRLIHVELRKMVDTLAGRWLVIVTLLIALAIMALAITFGDVGVVEVTMNLGVVAVAFAILLPVIGIMAATAEWSQRAGLVTFTLEPRRWRVIVARVMAGALLGTIVVLLSMALAYLVTAVCGLFGMTTSYSLSGPMAVGFLAMMVLLVLQGIGFGFVFLNTPLAVVSLLALPTVMSILHGVWSRMETIGPWIDLNAAASPLLNGSMSGTEVAQLGSASLLWIVLPLLIGAWRVMRREVK